MQQRNKWMTAEAVQRQAERDYAAFALRPRPRTQARQRASEPRREPIEGPQADGTYIATATYVRDLGHGRVAVVLCDPWVTMFARVRREIQLQALTAVLQLLHLDEASTRGLVEHVGSFVNGTLYPNESAMATHGVFCNVSRIRQRRRREQREQHKFKVVLPPIGTTLPTTRKGQVKIEVVE